MNFPPGMLPPGVGAPQPPPPPPETPLVVLARLIEGIPRYTVDFIFGMVIAIFSDVVMTALVIACVLLGLLASNWLVGAAAFFFVYVAMRAINNIAQAIGASGQRMAMALHREPHWPPQPETSETNSAPE